MKKITKFLKVAAVCPALLSTIACKEDPDKQLFQIEQEIEHKIEEDVFKCMQDVPLQKKKNFHLFDLKFIDITNKNNFYPVDNFLILSGDMITADYAGRVKGTILYWVGDESYELAKKIKETTSQIEKDGCFNENYAYQRYGQSITILKEILDDPLTRLDSVYDEENKCFVYKYYSASVDVNANNNETEEERHTM